MDISKVKETLLELPAPNKLLSKVNAFLQAARAHLMGGPQQPVGASPYQALEEGKAVWLELEAVRAEAEQAAQRARQKLV